MERGGNDTEKQGENPFFSSQVIPLHSKPQKN